MVALSRNLARKHCMQMLLTGEPISGQRAFEMGLVNMVVPSRVDGHYFGNCKQDF